MEELLNPNISFIKRPIPLPAEYRPLYKIALIILILKISCIGGKCSLIKMHLLSWALVSEKNMDELRRQVASNFTRNFAILGIEPALNRALQFAVAEDMCELEDGKSYKLSERGEMFFAILSADAELFRLEKAFLSSLGKRNIIDSKINSMTQKWTSNHA